MIVSTSNSKVKRIAALNSKAKIRKEEGVFIVEGAKMFREAPFNWIKEVCISESFFKKVQNNSDIMARLEKTGYELFADEVFKKISDTQTPQGILCVLSMPNYDIGVIFDKWKCGKSHAPFLIILEDLQDPGNLGTIMRAGEGAGIDGIIMTRQTADIFNPKVIRSTMGSIYRIPFFIVDELGDVIEILKENGVSVYAAHLDDSVCYDEPDYTKPTAFLIGNEGNGLKRGTADRASQYIKIPMLGQVESLNAAVAATVLMYESARQRRNH